MKKIVKALLATLVFLVSVNVLDAAQIKESSDKYTGDTYIIGSTRINGDVVLSAELAAQAGVNEAILQILSSDTNNINSLTDMLSNLNLKTYYYSELENKWSIINKDGGASKYLTEAETEAFEDNLNVYYTYEGKESDGVKTIEVTYEPTVTDGYHLTFSSGVESVDSLIDYDENTKKLTIPAIVKVVDVKEVNDTNEDDTHNLVVLTRDIYEETIADDELNNIIKAKEDLLVEAVFGDYEDDENNGIIGEKQGINGKYTYDTTLKFEVSNRNVKLIDYPINAIVDDIMSNLVGITEFSYSVNGVETVLSTTDITEDKILTFGSSFLEAMAGNGKLAGLLTNNDLVGKSMDITVTYKSSSGISNSVTYTLEYEMDPYAVLDEKLETVIEEKEEEFASMLENFNFEGYGILDVAITSDDSEYKVIEVTVADENQLVSEFVADVVSLMKNNKDKKENVEGFYYLDSNDDITGVKVSELNDSNLTEKVIEHAKAFLSIMSGKNENITLGDLVGKSQMFGIGYDYSEGEMGTSDTVGYTLKFVLPIA